MRESTAPGRGKLARQARPRVRCAPGAAKGRNTVPGACMVGLTADIGTTATPKPQATICRNVSRVLPRVRGRAVSFFKCSLKIGQAVSKQDRKSTRLNSSHVAISYAVFCLK